MVLWKIELACVCVCIWLIQKPGICFHNECHFLIVFNKHKITRSSHCNCSDFSNSTSKLLNFVVAKWFQLESNFLACKYSANCIWYCTRNNLVVNRLNWGDKHKMCIAFNTRIILPMMWDLLTPVFICMEYSYVSVFCHCMRYACVSICRKHFIQPD